MNDQNINKSETVLETTKPVNNFTFSLTCPHCQKTLTLNDFDSNHFTIAHLQSYFSSKESDYKQQLLLQLTQDPTLFPAYQQIKQETELLKSQNEQLKLILEGYKLGTTKSSKEKGEDLEKYICEQLQATYNGTDDISKITHVGTKADISQIVHYQGQTIGQIIYEIKNETK
jgi:uncharacterized protein DUF2130